MKKLNLKKALWLFSSAIGLLFFSVAAFAADNGPSLTNFFNVTKNDLSFQMLEQVFGQVGTVLTGTPALLNTMFKEFNAAMLVLVVIIVLYTVLISVVQTAHQGEFLGKKLDSMWLPIRTVAGVSLVIPTASGYSAIQIFMMWVVVQGIGAADVLWNASAKFLASGEAAVAQAGVKSDAGSKALMSPTKTLLMNLTCVHEGYKDKAGKDAKDDNYVPTRSVSDGNVTYNFVGTFGEKKKNCGSVSWAAPTSDSVSIATDDGLTAMVQTLNNTAKNVVYNTFPKTPDGDIDQPNPMTTAVSYVFALVNTAQQSEEDKPKDTDFYNKLVDRGWISAGAYYYKIIKQSGSPAANPNVKMTATPGSDSNANKLTKTDSALIDGINADALGIADTGGGPDIGDAVKGKWYKVLLKPITDYFDFASNYKKNVNNDPIISIQSFGTVLMGTIEGVWAGVLVVLGVSGLAMTGVSYATPAIGILFNLVVLGLAPLFAALVTLFGTAITMTFYIPMIPFIIFMFASIGWAIAVLETMVAAPLVAIGLTDPHGGNHEVLGRVEPALQLLVNVFLRPSLMIFGLLGGMILCRVSVGVLNTLFGIILGDVGTSQQAVVGLIMFLCIYLLLVMGIINRCYSLIHIIPDRVLDWIGWQKQFGEYSKGAEQEVKQGTSSAAGTTSRFGSGVAEKAAGGAQKWAEGKKGEGQKKKEEADKLKASSND